ncbi:asparagine synthetase B [bacterium DOLZORAL124_38_8]|nr:MAG: asparagine synthetase B [bacterium DOLZORAL124_38_8]
MCGFTAYTGTDTKIQTKLRLSFAKIKHRGPDKTITKTLSTGGWIGFHRLRIIDTTPKGDQPFATEIATLVCNGEIYEHQLLRQQFSSYEFQSESDCEVILPLMTQSEDKIEAVQKLDGEFAFALKHKSSWVVARDALGIRPLFYAQDESGDFYFASEAKVLTEVCKKVLPFPPGKIFIDGQFYTYHDYSTVKTDEKILPSTAEQKIHDLLSAGVKKRLEADVPVGFLLSGGLDSSLVCSIASRISAKPIRTFAIGIEGDAIDTKYARMVADHLGTEHTEVIFSQSDIFNALEDLIYLLETWDITTIRASIGMYLLVKYISEKTDIKVVLTGEVSDELFGYKYTDFAPSEDEFQREAQKRVRELYLYDVLRADRCIAGVGLEARVPFSDKAFVDFVMSVPVQLKMNTTGIGKHLLRKSFATQGHLPDSILWREKAAFSDAVGHSMVDIIKAFAEDFYGDDWQIQAQKYQHGTPFTKESLLYREIFEKHFSGHAGLIPDFWMPNKEWEGCAVDDPSARVLKNYGKSGE